MTFSICVQVNECEAIMPLSLAKKGTCVVLAGDHLQLKNKVYSKVAQQLKFDTSIVERLHHHYHELQQLQQEENRWEPVVRLTLNYRNKKEITEFMSAVFYDNKLKCANNQPEVSGISPVNFYAAYGTEQHLDQSTSWCNTAEVGEVVTRVSELCAMWPADKWGQVDYQQILVTAAYSDQVDYHFFNCFVWQNIYK